MAVGVDEVLGDDAVRHSWAVFGRHSCVGDFDAFEPVSQLFTEGLKPSGRAGFIILKPKSKHAKALFGAAALEVDHALG